MAKAFDDETNDILRRLARDLVMKRFGGIALRLAEMLEVSPSFVSEFLSGKRGGGLAMLTGLGRLAPLEFLGMLDIDPGVVAALHEGTVGAEGTDLMTMPEVIRRAARAAIELEGCSPGAAGDAAMAAFEEHGSVPGTDVDWWLGKIRKRITETGKSGERPSVRLRKAEESRG